MPKDKAAIVQEIDRIANSTSFNGVNLLNGSSSSLTFQVGIRASENDRIEFKVSDSDVRAGTLGIEGIGLTSMGDARDSLETVDQALNKLLATRASLGAIQNRLQSTLKTNDAISAGLSAARSNISDTDFAVEVSNLTKANIIQQAGVAVLGQANVAPAQALRLLI